MSPPQGLGARIHFASPPHRGWVPKSYSVTLHGTTAIGATNRKKPFAGVSHPSKGSGATVEYLYLGIRAKGLMSVTLPHPKVKDALWPRLIPRGRAMSRPTPRTRFSPCPTLGAGPRLIRPQGVGSDSSGPTGSAPPRPTPEGRISSRPARRARFPPRPFPRGQICYWIKTVTLGWDPNCFNHYGMEVHNWEHVSDTSRCDRRSHQAMLGDSRRPSRQQAGTVLPTPCLTTIQRQSIGVS